MKHMVLPNGVNIWAFLKNLFVGFYLYNIKKLLIDILLHLINNWKENISLGIAY